jgi:MFS transporter, ACS family, allantoate permease
MAVRFFLGLFEAAVTPGFALFTSQWYTKKEQGTRIGIWTSFNGVAGICGGLLAYGIARGFENKKEGIVAWKVLFLVTGLVTIVIGVIFLWIIPDNQLNARWLSRKDRLLAIERIRINQQGIGNKTFKIYQLKEALLDPLTWAFVFYALMATIPNGESINKTLLKSGQTGAKKNTRHYIELLLAVDKVSLKGSLLQSPGAEH